ncbi:hypothetical protein D9M71_486870 [compost metagenome]
MQAAFLEPDLLLVGQVGSHGRVGDRQVLDVDFAEKGANPPEDPFAANRPQREADVEQTQHVQIVQGFHPAPVHRQLAGGIDATDHCAHRAAGDAGDLVAARLQFLDHADMCIAPCSAGAEHQCDTLAHDDSPIFCRTGAATVPLDTAQLIAGLLFFSMAPISMAGLALWCLLESPPSRMTPGVSA